MDWYEVTGEYHSRTFPHESRLSSLREDWQREMAALWRLEADVNNGGYLQFLMNWGYESYVYASAGLKRIGAERMAQIIDQCQALVDEHHDTADTGPGEVGRLHPMRVLQRDGRIREYDDEKLPDSIVQRVLELSYEFMDYPEDLASLGLKHYSTRVTADSLRGKPS